MSDSCYKFSVGDVVKDLYGFQYEVLELGTTITGARMYKVRELFDLIVRDLYASAIEGKGYKLVSSAKSQSPTIEGLADGYEIIDGQLARSAQTIKAKKLNGEAKAGYFKTWEAYHKALGCVGCNHADTPSIGKMNCCLCAGGPEIASTLSPEGFFCKTREVAQPAPVPRINDIVYGVCFYSGLSRGTITGFGGNSEDRWAELETLAVQSSVTASNLLPAGDRVWVTPAAKAKMKRLLENVSLEG